MWRFRMSSCLLTALVLGLVGARQLQAQTPSHGNPLDLAIRSAIATPFALRSTATVKPRALSSWKGVSFFEGQVPGPHSMLTGYAARLPSGSILPMGSPVTRRMLSGFVQLNPEDSTQLIQYAADVARVERNLPSATVVIAALESLPAGIRERLTAVGRTVAGPRIERTATGSTSVGIFLLSPSAAIYRVRFIVGPDRFLDDLAVFEAVLGG